MQIFITICTGLKNFTWSAACACLDCSKKLMWSVMRERMVVAIDETLTLLRRPWPIVQHCKIVEAQETMDALNIVARRPQQWSRDGHHTTGHWLEAGHSGTGTPPIHSYDCTQWITGDIKLFKKEGEAIQRIEETKPGNTRRAAWEPQQVQAPLPGPNILC